MRDTWTPVYVTFCNCRWKQKLEGTREDRDILFTRSKYDVDGGSMMGSSRSSLLSLFPIFGFSPLFTLLLPLTLFLLGSPVFLCAKENRGRVEIRDTKIAVCNNEYLYQKFCTSVFK